MRKTFTFLGVTLVLMIILLMGAIKPTITKITDLNAEIKVKSEVNDKLQEKINNIGKLQEEYEERKEDLSVIEVFFPKDMDYSLVLASLEKVTEKYGFELSSVSITLSESEDSEYKDMEVVNIRITGEGRNTKVTQLLKHLEELPIVPNLKSVSISPDEDSDEEDWVDVGINMKVFKTV
jgi:Tfp pilus assembly protein PilO